MRPTPLPIESVQPTEKHPDPHVSQLKNELAEFVYIVSHDLNAPMRHIREFTRLLLARMRDRTSPEEQQLVQIIEQAIQQSEDMLEGLLQYSRIHTHSQAFSRVDCNLVAERVRHSFEWAIARSRAEIRIGNLPVVYGDEGQLTQLFHHLLDNAIKFRAANAPLEIEINATQEEDHWNIYVRDNGIGMPEEYCDRIFTLFRRLYPDGSYPGIGAGLAICRKIIERHGGNIGCESEPNKGTTIRFSLPDIKSIPKA